VNNQPFRQLIRSGTTVTFSAVPAHERAVLHWPAGAQQCTTRYPHDRETTNWPWPGSQIYRATAAALGYGADQLMEYCFEHEFCHSALAMLMFGRASLVVWRSAHQQSPDLGNDWEEKMVFYFQRYLHDFIPAPAPEWPGYAEQMRQLLSSAA
jgi:hypothetical protein